MYRIEMELSEVTGIKLSKAHTTIKNILKNFSFYFFKSSLFLKLIIILLSLAIIVKLNLITLFIIIYLVIIIVNKKYLLKTIYKLDFNNKYYIRYFIIIINIKKKLIIKRFIKLV